MQHIKTGRPNAMAKKILFVLELDRHGGTRCGENEGRGQDVHQAHLPGVGHGFQHAQHGRDEANLAASHEACPETIGFLKKQLEK
jgi:hypothetical protein